MSSWGTRVETGNYLIHGGLPSSAPVHLNCGPLGTFYTVWGNFTFNIIVTISCLYGPIYLAASLGNEKNLFALFTSLSITAVVIARKFQRKSNDRIALALNIAFVLLLSLTIIPFFFAVGPVVKANHRELYDKYLVMIDNGMLGWLYPDGQISLALDQSKHLNPSTGFGRFYTEVLQICYVSYYLWGYLVLLVLGIRYVLAWRRADGDEVNRNLAQAKLFLTGWLSAYLMVFLCNTILPAVSPRLYFKKQYKHPLEGWIISKLLIKVATDDQSFGSFPSGHFAESLIAGIYMIRIHKPLGILIIAFSALIGIATQMLRYHYVIDLIGAAIVCIFCLSVGFCLTSGMWHREIERIMAYYVSRFGTQHSMDGHFQSREELEEAATPISIQDRVDSPIDLESQLPTLNANTVVHTLL